MAKQVAVNAEPNSISEFELVRLIPQNSRFLEQAYASSRTLLQLGTALEATGNETPASLPLLF
jgi:hypothetical protein